MMRRADPRIEWTPDQFTLLRAAQDIARACHYMVDAMLLEADIEGLSGIEAFLKHAARQKMQDLQLR